MRIKTAVSCQKFRNIIVIEDDGISEVENVDEVEYSEKDCDAGLHKLPSGGKSTFRISSTFQWSSSDEECFVVDAGVGSKRQNYSSRSKKRPARRRRCSINDNLSDCEIVENSCENARQLWEEAALRRRMGSIFNTSRFTAESEGSTSMTDSGANGASADDTPVNNSGKEQQCAFEAIPVNLARTLNIEERDNRSATLDQQLSSTDFIDPCDESVEICTGEELLFAGNTLSSSRSDEVKSDGDGVGSTGIPCHSVFLTAGLSPLEVKEISEMPGGSDDIGVQQKACEVVQLMGIESNLILNKEKLKETDDFRKADEEEWARRQLELQKQAQEAQRERKRKRLETERRLEMENRQRRRLAEIRQSQEKEERNLGYKELLRGRIQLELEHIAASCKDMATLLCRLGVPVDGGALPTPQHVNAAYKKALLRFHPDRIAAIAKSNPRRQVEAEETFKLISRMKSVLQPVTFRKL